MAQASGKACLLVTNLFPPALGGSAEVYAALAAHTGGGIVILTSSHDHQTGQERPGWREFDRGAGYHVHRLTCIRPFFRKAYKGLSYRLHEAATAFRLVTAILKLSHRYRVQAICVADDETLGWLVPVSRFLLGRRALIYCHGDDLQGAAKDVARRSRWLHLAHTIVAANRYAAGLLATRFAVARDRIVLVENGVDLAVFHPQAAPASFVERHGLKERQVLVTVTRLVPRKGVDKVLEAMPAVARLFPRAVYLIAGDGPQRSELEALAGKLGIADRVIFAGAVPHDETVDFYACADLVLLPNREEKGDADGLPLVFLEAGACAKPVIGGHAGGTAEVIHDGENGFVVDGRDVAAIEAAICRLLANDDLRAVMGQKGLQMAQSWGWRSRAKLFLQTCRS
jgi:phosphatidylinositol alpha-1,6-mannosyltransferase